MPEPYAHAPLLPSPDGCAALIATLMQDPRVRDIVMPLAAQAAREERTLAALLGDEPASTGLEDDGAVPLAPPGKPLAPPPRWPSPEA